MIASKAKVNGNSLSVTQMKISVRLGRESSNYRLHRSLLVNVGEEALLEHSIGVELGRFLDLRLRRSRLRVSLLVLRFLLSRGLGSSLLGSLLSALLQLVARDLLSRHLVKHELDSALGDLSDRVGHDVNWYKIVNRLLSVFLMSFFSNLENLLAVFDVEARGGVIFEDGKLSRDVGGGGVEGSFGGLQLGGIES